jgi:pantetheine-phosphate adenylyltransferase
LSPVEYNGAILRERASMVRRAKSVAVFPGSFDPITRGHLDILRRGAALFDMLVVAVAASPQKDPLLDLDSRARAVRRAARGLANVRVRTYRGLTVDFARSVGAGVILRGVRDASDLHAELQMAAANRAATGVETVLLPTDPRHAFLSSTLIRQLARGGADVSALVPPEVLAMLRLRPSKAGAARTEITDSTDSRIPQIRKGKKGRHTS